MPAHRNDYVKRWRATGSVKADKFGGHKKYKLAAHADKVKALVKTEPDQTVAELQAKLEAVKIKASASAIWRKMQKTLDPTKLLFIDETWASPSMTRRYGRAPSCERLLGFAPGGHWKTTTFIAALRHDRLTAPWVLDGPINGAPFWRMYIKPSFRPCRRRATS